VAGGSRRSGIAWSTTPPTRFRELQVFGQRRVRIPDVSLLGYPFSAILDRVPRTHRGIGWKDRDRFGNVIAFHVVGADIRLR